MTEIQCKLTMAIANITDSSYVRLLNVIHYNERSNYPEADCSQTERQLVVIQIILIYMAYNVVEYDMHFFYFHGFTMFFL